jgi:hypothetical protein
MTTLHKKIVCLSFIWSLFLTGYGAMEGARHGKLIKVVQAWYGAEGLLAGKPMAAPSM